MIKHGTPKLPSFIFFTREVMLLPFGSALLCAAVAKAATYPKTHSSELEVIVDYVIVGGGTVSLAWPLVSNPRNPEITRKAGSVLANRLSEDPSTTVAVIEGGPSDVGLPEVQVLKDWISLLETKYD